MKGKLPLFLRLTLAVILAISFSLAPMAVQPKPVSAVGALVTVGPVPNAAGAAAAYFIRGTTLGAWVATVTTFQVNFPVGTTTVASAAGTITVNGTPTAVAATVPAAAQLQITTPVAVAAGAPFTIVYSQTAGIINPAAGTPLTAGAIADLDGAGAGAAEATIASAAYTIVAATAGAAQDIIVEVGSSVNQPVSAVADLQRAIAGPSRTVPTITVNVGDTVTFKPGRNGVVALATTGVHTSQSGERYTIPTGLYTGAALVGDFNPGGAINVTLNASPQTINPVGATVSTGVGAGAPAAGIFLPVSFKIPPISRKTSSSPAVLKFSDGATDITVNVVVNQRAKFTPDKAAKGRTITVTGDGFRSSSSINIEVRTEANLSQTGTAIVVGGTQVLTNPFGGLHHIHVIQGGTFTITMPAGTAGVISGANDTEANFGTGVVATPALAVGTNLAAGANIITASSGMFNFFFGPATTVARGVADTGNLTGYLAGTPHTIGINSNDITTVSVATAGTFTITTPAGVSGFVSSGTSTTSANATVTTSPVTLPALTATTITTTTAGQMVVSLNNANANPSGVATRVSQATVTTDSNGSFSTTFAAPEVMSTSLSDSINVQDGGDARSNAAEIAKDIREFTMDPSMTITPNNGTAGSTVTIEGSEFVPGSAFVSLTIGGEPITTDVLGNALSVKTANAIGGTGTPGKVEAFQVKAPLTLTGGAKSVAMTFGITSSSGSFTVGAAALSLTPATGPKNNEIVIGISNMPVAAGTAVLAANVTIGGLPVLNFPTTAPTTDSNGNVSFTVRVPNTATIGAQDVSVTVGGSQATGIFNVQKPTITINPTTQSRSGIVSITGTGWVSDRNVTIDIGGGTTTVNATPDAAGKFTAAFTVSTDFNPDSNQNIVASDRIAGGVGNIADTVVLKVPAAAITISPAQIAWGGNLTIKGTGFPGGFQVSYGLPWTGAGAATSFSPAVYTDSAGNFTATLVVPTVTKGVRSIGAAAGGSSATSTVEIAEGARSIATDLGSIATQLVRVWGFDAATQTWKLYDPSVPAELNTLSALNRGSGYFINVKAATTITNGSGVTVSLSPGWQILGW